MKRSFLIASVIGLTAAMVIAVLHATGALIRLELAMGRVISDFHDVTPAVGGKWQSLSIVVLAVGVSWLTMTSVRRGRIGLLVLSLLLELFALSLICSLYQLFFQPLPSMLAVALSFVVAEGWIVLSRRTRSHLARTFFADHLSRKQVRRMIEGEIPL